MRIAVLLDWIVLPAETRVPRYHRSLPILIAGLATIGPFTIDTYLPSFPAMAADMGVSQTMVQQTLTAYLIPFAFMMLFHGAISDAFGRRPVILVGLAGYVIASVACAFAPNMTVLLIGRALQGLVAGAGTSISRAIVRDAYQGFEAQRMMSRVMMMFALAPAVAPLIGGTLQMWFGWRANFWFLAGFGSILLVACWRYLPETHPPHARQRFAPAPLLAAYRHVGLNARFVLLSCVTALAFAAMFIYVLSAPVFIYRHLGLNEHGFAWLFLAGVLGMLMGSYLAGRLAGKLSPRNTAWLGFAFMFAAAAYNNLYYLWFAPQVPWSVLHQVAGAFGMALVMPCATLMMLDLFPQNRGMAASLQGCLQSLIIAFVAAVAAPLFSSSAAFLALGSLLLALAGLALWLAYLALPKIETRE